MEETGLDFKVRRHRCGQARSAAEGSLTGANKDAKDSYFRVTAVLPVKFPSKQRETFVVVKALMVLTSLI